MKIIIDISDEVFDDIQHNKGEYINTLNWAVRNGIVLPEGHGDLIDTNALIMGLDEYNEYVIYCSNLKDA